MAFTVAVILHNILPEEEDPEALQSAARKNADHYGATNDDEHDLAIKPVA